MSPERPPEPPGDTFDQAGPSQPRRRKRAKGEIQSAGHARRRHLSRDCGRGFDSHRLHSREPRGARVELRCSGKRCRFKRKRAAKPRRGKVNALKALKRPQLRFRAGQALEVRITKSGWIGKAARYKMRKRKLPRSSGALCIPLGRTKPQRRC